MRSLNSSLDHKDKPDWDEVLQDANVDPRHESKHGWVNRKYSHSHPVEDFLYSITEPPDRDRHKSELFGLAKSFPQVTRSGYKQHLYDELKNKANRSKEDDEWLHQEDERMINAEEGRYGRESSGLHMFNRKDFGWFYRFRDRYHAEMAEFIGMFVFICIGLASTCQMALGSPQYSNWIALTFTWGFANMAGIYIAGGYSGAHLNPVVTFNLWFFRGFPFRRMFCYWIAQLLAVVCATAWVFILYYPALRQRQPHEWTVETGKDFYVSIQKGIPVASGWFNEVTGTAMIHIIVFAVGDSHNIAPARGMNALVIGFSVMALGCSFGYLTGFGLNPARDLGPRLFMSMVGIPNAMWTEDKWWWVTGEITGPFLGGFLGSLAYDVFVFDGPESPVNMPRDVQRRGLRILAHDIMHPFSKHGFQFPHDPNDSGKVTLEGQPAGQRRADERND